MSMAIDEDIDRGWSLTIKGNAVAVTSDGTAVLGLGDISPQAAMPVMEGKAPLFKGFAGVDAFRCAWPRQDTESIVGTPECQVRAQAPLDLEAVWRRDVLQVDRAESRRHRLDELQ